jgi:hypothetical protein
MPEGHWHQGLLARLQATQPGDRRIVESADHDRADPQRGGLKEQVLRRVAGFQMRVADAAGRACLWCARTGPR